MNNGERLELIGCIIDVFDDFLEDKGIRIPSSDKDMEEDGELIGNEARIYGSDYGLLSDEIETVLKGWRLL